MICRTFTEIMKYGPDVFRSRSRVNHVLARSSDALSSFPVFVGSPAELVQQSFKQDAESKEEDRISGLVVDPQTGVEEAIRFLSQTVKGRGGLIALNKNGVGIAFNTPRMAYAFHTDAQSEMVVGIDPHSFLS